jgi:hypothetical protein
VRDGLRGGEVGAGERARWCMIKLGCWMDRRGHRLPTLWNEDVDRMVMLCNNTRFRVVFLFFFLV